MEGSHSSEGERNSAYPDSCSHWPHLILNKCGNFLCQYPPFYVHIEGGRVIFMIQIDICRFRCQAWCLREPCWQSLSGQRTGLAHHHMVQCAENVHVGQEHISSLEHGGHCVQLNVTGGRTKCSVSTDGPNQTQPGQLRPSEQNLQTCCLYACKPG